MSEINTFDEIDENLAVASKALGNLGGRRPEIALILGSGLGKLADELEDATCIPYTSIPHMKTSTTQSHVGQFVCGRFAGKEIIVMQGRLHGYEGNTSSEVAFPIRLLARLGVKTLIVTNAAGAINEAYEVGDFCIISDHINFTGRNPIVGVGSTQDFDRFFSMTAAYDPHYREVAHAIALQEKVQVHEGVYVGVLGPSFETPAEIKAFRSWGADVVGMSTVEEVIAARHMKMRVLGISLIANMAAGIGGASPDGEEVLDVARRQQDGFSRFLKGILPKL